MIHLMPLHSLLSMQSTSNLSCCLKVVGSTGALKGSTQLKNFVAWFEPSELSSNGDGSSYAEQRLVGGCRSIGVANY